MSATRTTLCEYVVWVRDKSTPDASDFPPLSQDVPWWEWFTDQDQESHVAAARAVCEQIGCDDGKSYAAYVCKRGETIAEGRKFWISGSYVKTSEGWEYSATATQVVEASGASTATPESGPAEAVLQ